MIKKLKEHGAAWDVCDNAGMTALHWAVDGGHAKVVQYLIKEGIPVRIARSGVSFHCYISVAKGGLGGWQSQEPSDACSYPQR